MIRAYGIALCIYLNDLIFHSIDHPVITCLLFFIAPDKTSIQLSIFSYLFAKTWVL